ncbi:MAG: ECF-type sigma factor [Phycisphaerae bacterium]
MNSSESHPSKPERDAASGHPSRLVVRVYDDLRAVAEAYLRRERLDHTLQPTALVHEAYLRLAELDRMEFRDEAHFAGAAAGAIRRVLVDHARGKQAAKRGGDWQRLTLSGLDGMPEVSGVDLLALNEALEKLSGLDESCQRIVELRFFGGMTIAETAGTLDIGVTTVKEKWEFARVWLRRELGEETPK